MSKFIAFLFVLYLAFPLQIALANLITYGQRLCHSNAHLSCLVVKQGDTWNSLWPDVAQQQMAMRINRINTKLYLGMQLVEPTQMNAAITQNLLPFPENIGTQDTKSILISPKELAWAAYDMDGKMVRWGPASTARGFCSDIGKSCNTPRGSFTIYRKGGKACQSSEFPIPTGGAPMPYCMFFKDGIALHGSDKLPGYNASHGCVRILSEDAKWLNDTFIELGSTKVTVEDSIWQAESRS